MGRTLVRQPGPENSSPWTVAIQGRTNSSIDSESEDRQRPLRLSSEVRVTHRLII